LLQQLTEKHVKPCRFYTGLQVQVYMTPALGTVIANRVAIASPNLVTIERKMKNKNKTKLQKSKSEGLVHPQNDVYG
jgi:Holliday junction resolvase